jgi:hypothetical protein
MTHTSVHDGRTRFGILAVLAVLLLASAGVGPANACEKPAADAVAVDAAAEAAAAEARKLAEQWGIEVTSIRLSANDHMIDYRYRVLDAGKATDLFKRQIKPNLIHQSTEKVLSVPETAKLGPLRNSNMPQEGRIYWMFFGNAGKLVKAGDKVTVVIGDFRVENLVVE